MTTTNAVMAEAALLERRLSLCMEAAESHRHTVLIPWVVEVTQQRVATQRARWPLTGVTSYGGALPSAATTAEIWRRLVAWQGDGNETLRISVDADRNVYCALHDARRDGCSALEAAWEAAVQARYAATDAFRVTAATSPSKAAVAASVVAANAVHEAYFAAWHTTWDATVRRVPWSSAVCHATTAAATVAAAADKAATEAFVGSLTQRLTARRRSAR
jgi:hypothetical protein